MDTEADAVPVARAKRRQLRLGGAVTYSVLASILTAAASLGVWALKQHDSAGHPRHDAQIVAIEASMQDRLREHAQYEAGRVQLLLVLLARIEKKQDLALVADGIPFPADLPKFTSIPDLGVDPLLRADAGVP